VQNILLKRFYVYGVDDLGFGSRQGQEIILSSKSFRSAVGPTQRPIELVPGFCPDDKATFDTIFTSHLRLLPRLRKGGAMFALPYIIVTIHNQKGNKQCAYK
jgi:hypothetical protein